MASWLSGFRSSSIGASAEPQPFELVCACNVKHSGVRRKTSQRIVCRTCGVSLFVLPRDSYPPPPNSETIRKAPKSRKKNTEPATPEPAPASPRLSRHKRRRMQGGDEEVHPVAVAAQLTSDVIATAAGAAGKWTRSAGKGVKKASQASATTVWRFWTPLRIVALGICLVTVGGLLWSVRSGRIEQAQRDLNPAIEAGLAAIEEGEIGRAAEQLQVASQALDRLKQTDPYSETIRQLARETTALNRLSVDSLVVMLEQADDLVETAQARRLSTKTKSDEEPDKPLPPLDANWITRFEVMFQGNWVVLEAPVRKLPGKDKQQEHRYQVLVPIEVGPKQHGVELRADFDVFRQLGVGESPQNAVLAGQLKSCRFDEKKQRWQVELDPQTGFLWVNLKTYRFLNFNFTDWHLLSATEELLTRQAQAAGIEPLGSKAQSPSSDLPSPDAEPVTQSPRKFTGEP